MSNPNRLSEREILVLVNDYIGSSDGYLEGFSYAKHEEFYALYCDFEVNVREKRKSYGTTRNTFIEILRESEPAVQVRIVEGTTRYFESRDKTGLSETKAVARQTLLTAVARIRGGPVVTAPDLKTASETVRQAVSDAEVLLNKQGPKSAVDRVHTAFHGYLKALCQVAKVDIPKMNPSPHELWGLLRKSSVFGDLLASHPEKEVFERLLGSLGGIVTSTETLRNKLSLVHPNEELIQTDEAVLAIDAMHTLVNYLSRKFPPS
ncbi:MAG: abortive infection family protein [Planctomycetes bacterium]|nr:abortive infection family protein [Planctomycetota bacterium]